MSDRSVSIVPRRSVFPDNDNKSLEILQWLVSLNVVSGNASACILGEGKGFAVAEGAKGVVSAAEFLPFGIDVCGLELITQRQVFHAGEYGIDQLICPSCKADFVNEPWDFFDEWYSMRSDHLICPLCNVASDIHRFSFSPQWGFSNLGFTFWNWPDFNAEFLNEFRRKLGGEIDVVYAHI